MSARTQTSFTAHWIGKCTAKGCKVRLHVDIAMLRESWREIHHNHAYGTQFEVGKSRTFPAPGHDDRLYSLGLHCVAHRWPIVWRPVNGSYSQVHVCDARCMNATGTNCECSCGGENHGRGHHVELVWKDKI